MRDPKKPDGRRNNGATPKGPGGAVRDQWLRVRISSSERDAVEKVAEDLGQSVSEMVRQMLFVAPPAED